MAAGPGGPAATEGYPPGMPGPSLRTYAWALCTVILAFTPLDPARSEELLLDGIAAQVGSDIVLVSEVMELVGPSEQRLRAAGAPEIEVAKLRAEALESMIEQRIVEKVVRDTDLRATDAEVDETIQAIAQENGISVEQLEASVSGQSMSVDDYKAQIRRELERRKVVSALVATQVHLEESEIEAAYQERFADQPDGGSQLHLRQLLVPAGKEVNLTLAESCAMALQLRQRIETGESFEELARQYSAAAPAQGGDIGWLHQDSLASWMLAAVGPLEDGGVSSVIELPFGCTLIKLVERTEYKPVSYEDAKVALHAELYDKRVAEEYRVWMEKLRDRTFIERRGYFAQTTGLGGNSKGQRSATLP